MAAFRLFDKIIAQDITLVTGCLSASPQIYNRERLDQALAPAPRSRRDDGDASEP